MGQRAATANDGCETRQKPKQPAGQGKATGMTARLLKKLILRLCPHRFSWPHSGLHGQDYQVCLICGAAFEYDWTTMRRTRPLVTPGLADGDQSVSDSGSMR
jgi:hypothetical protein